MHNEPVEIIESPAHFEQGRYVEHRTLKIYMDDDPIDPRGNDNVGTMVCFHRRYSLGDKGHGIDDDDFSSFAEMEEYIIKEKSAVVIIPLYLYDHSGITMRVYPFGDRWDSGQVGFIYATRKDILNNWGGKRLTKDLIQKTHKMLEAEVQEYDDYLTGNVYGYVLEDENGDEVESCWGFPGDDAVEQIKASLNIQTVNTKGQTCAEA
jgi:hypothetical protein